MHALTQHCAMERELPERPQRGAAQVPAVSSLECQSSAFHAPPGAKHDNGISPFLSKRPYYVEKARLMPGANRFAWRETMKWPISHLRSSGILGASVLIFASLFSSQLALGSTQIIPPDRNFAWNPGMMSKGGIPNRTAICATLSPSGRDDSAAIQAQLDSCPSGQVVMLNPGTFIVNNLLLLHSPITLRGSGRGVTILNKPNGSHTRTPVIEPGTNNIHVAEPPYTTGSFTGSISGSTMTITAVSSGALNAGDLVSGTGVA